MSAENGYNEREKKNNVDTVCSLFYFFIKMNIKGILFC